jgi:sulfite exporter TauE/SafE
MKAKQSWRTVGMSKGKVFGLAFAEKIIGIILALIGVALAYYTTINPNAAGMGTNYFIVAGILLVIIGLTLTIVETK